MAGRAPDGRASLGRERIVGLVDPILSTPEELEEAATRLREAEVRRVVLMGNSVQSRFFAGAGFDATVVGLECWPVRARQGTERAILEALAAARRSVDMHVELEVGRASYRLDLVQLAVGRLGELRTQITIAHLWSVMPEVEEVLVTTNRKGFGSAVETFARGALRSDVGIRTVAVGSSGPKRGPGWSERRREILRFLREVPRVVSSPGGGKPLVIVARHRNSAPVQGPLERTGTVCAVSDLFLSLLRRFQPEPNIPPSVRKRASELLSALMPLVRHSLSPFEGRAADAFLLQFGRVLEQDLRSCAREILALDLIDPDGILSMNWLGIPAHPQRVWCAHHQRTFAVVQHGMGMGSRLSPLTRDIDADVFYCWGGEFRDRWMSPETPGEVEIMALGNPAGKIVPQEARRTLSEPTTVLVAPSGAHEMFSDVYIEFWESIIGLATAEGPQYDWVFRPHNMCRYRDYVRFQANRHGIRFSPSSESFGSAVAEADIVITSMSSAAFEAFAGGRPVIIHDLAAHPEYLSHYDAGIYVDAVADIQGVLRELRDPDALSSVVRKQEAFIRSFCAGGDGAEAIARDLAGRLESSLTASGVSR